MLHFECDYAKGAHPRIIEKLAETNAESTAGYGEDEFCESAREKIREAVGKPDAAVFFLVGGTQTNATVIAHLLRPIEGVISADTGHINGHEGGAIESCGHKVITLKGENGKLSAKAVREYLEGYYADEAWQHIARPGMVYISFPTEYGTVYTKYELEELRRVCKDYTLRLFIDGARMGYGLAAEGGDVTLRDIAGLADVFYIGGTKVGALFGEAVVFPDPELGRDFFTVSKQHGAVLAKGRLLGIQFDVLFTGGLYNEISRNAVTMASKLKAALREKGYEFYIDSPTNQVFVTVENSRLEELAKHAAFSRWEPFDNERTVIRLCTDWATTDKEIEELQKYL